MNYIYYFIAAIFIPISAIAQLQDDFSDGDFTTAPMWSGNVGNFVVNTEQELQLQVPDGVDDLTSHLSIAAPTMGRTTWEFSLRLAFSPSGENFTRIYLTADRADLSNVINGYYVRIGNSGTQDALELYRQDGDSHTLLISGTPAAVASSPTLDIRVERSDEQEWTLFADYEQDGNYVTEGMATDATYLIGQFFGWQCNYTASRRDKFFLDNVFINPLFVDDVPPQILATEVVDANTISILFDEILETSSVNDFSNYNFDPALTLSTAQLDGNNGARLILTTNEAFTDGTNYELIINNISDENGNAVSNLTTNFTFIQIETAAPYDILINEIMADPTPAIGLPEAEFIELYNRSDKNINLENFELLVGNNIRLLPDFTLAANDYVILADDNDAVAFTAFGKTLAIDLPALRNSGEQISLNNSNSDLLHAINYSTTWYQNGDKDDGGFTLELINPLAPCLAGIENWRASENGNGGTPGRTNSVLESNFDNANPILQRAFPVNAERIRLFFDKKMDLATAEELANYSIENIEIANAELELPNAQTVLLQLATPLVAGQAYTIEVRSGVQDCNGNALAAFTEVTTALPATIEPRDIIINELLYRPLTGGSDFVELYNQSDKVLNISDLILANRDDRGVLNVVRPIENDYLLFPQTYVVLTEDRNAILESYPQNPCNSPTFGSNFIENDLPSYPVGEGTVVIYLPDTLQERIIDEFNYMDDLHNPLIDDERGVSLERISFSEPTRSTENWYSASATVGFATPGCPNSVGITDRNGAGNAESIFTLESTTFSPDGDGFEDFLIINYLTDQPDFVATLQIYDMNGRLVKTLLNNESLATEGFIKWDGSNDAEVTQRARLGIYIIYAQLFDTNGNVVEYKETCALAAPLD
ncbi:MAG: lamin tail domain-containing protein [Saprospiraceae bacterium]